MKKRFYLLCIAGFLLSSIGSTALANTATQEQQLEENIISTNQEIENLRTTLGDDFQVNLKPISNTKITFNNENVLHFDTMEDLKVFMLEEQQKLDAVQNIEVPVIEKTIIQPRGVYNISDSASQFMMPEFYTGNVDYNLRIENGRITSCSMTRFYLTGIVAGSYSHESGSMSYGTNSVTGAYSSGLFTWEVSVGGGVGVGGNIITRKSYNISFNKFYYYQ